MNPDELVQRNTDAIRALEQAIDRLRELRKGADLEDRKRFNREIARAGEEIIELETVNGHLRAAATVIDPISPETEARLDELANRLDRAILSDFKFNAALDTVMDVISFAQEIGSIIDSHEHA